MPKINVLEKHVAELIAAGEVIERPASIVKELLENAIDAGATSITVEIKSGGIRYIRITDNGCGIAAEDVPTAFLRHATSKVRYEYDLESIGTLGFRGEALASVCAVARVEMLTKTADAQFGTRIELAGGEQISLSEAGCPDGTTIVVRDLFYNVPARLKFLKRDMYEGGLVASIVDKIALSNPQISIRFIKENKVELHTPGDGSVLSAIYAVFGKEFAKSLIPVDYTFENIKISGMVSIPELSRINRKSQHFFVNSRYVKSRTCAGALEEAYRGSIMAGKFPACVLYLEVPSDTVDVNVHPAKTEIRFINEKTVYDATLFGVKSGIAAYNKRLVEESHATEQTLIETRLSAGPAVSLDYPTKTREFAYQGEQTTLHRTVETSPKETLQIGEYKIKLEEDMPCSVADREETAYHVAPESSLKDANISPNIQQKELKYLNLEQIFNAQEADAKPSADPEPIPSTPEIPSVENNATEPETAVPIRICGELFRTYILAEAGDSFVMVDKHAAHERILYEKLKASQGDIEGQMLLTPLTLTLPREDYAALLDNKERLHSFGFDIDDFGRCTIQVRETPIFLDLTDATQVLLELGSNLRKNKRDITPALIDDLLHSIACKAAIKAHDKNGEQELLEIVRTVYMDEQIRYCPHGRPVVITMSKYELEKKFHRVV